MGKFVAAPGQVDFSHIRWAPVINCIVRYGEKILLVKRSSTLNFYPDYWNGVSGFLDDQKSLEEKVYEEIKEELQLGADVVEKIQYGQVFDQDEPQYNKTWIVHPVLVDVATDNIQTDWESASYEWVSVSEAMTKKLLPGFDRVLRTFFHE